VAEPASVARGRTSFALEAESGGRVAGGPRSLAGDRVEVELRPAERCDVSGASPVPSDEVGVRRFERPESLPPRLRTTRSYLFDGGCVTYRFEIDGADAAAALAIDRAISFMPRAELVQRIDDETGLSLCGAGAPPCPGGEA
jgi:hypothetical protein